jgi:Ca-activated chloride channel family protein
MLLPMLMLVSGACRSSEADGAHGGGSNTADPGGISTGAVDPNRPRDPDLVAAADPQVGGGPAGSRVRPATPGSARPITPAATPAMNAPKPLQKGDDRTLSPYFFVKSEDPAIDQLPLKSTTADVNIAGVIADVTVTQVYKNEGKRPLEAVYTFPASTRAAVYAMKMTIGDRTIVAKIQKREEARRQYEEARIQGRSASLLEQERPNVFQMNVANIMPGDEIQVEMRYTELLVPTDGIYEFVYPTVVGPRYSNQPAATAKDSDRWVANPYTRAGVAPTYSFDLTATLSTGLPIQEVAVPTHKSSIAYDGPSVATILLDESEQQAGNRDYILRYRLAGGQVESGLLLYPGRDENFFLLMTQPPKQVKLEQIPPREYIFVVDVSGSMHGYPLEVSKTLLRDLIGHLRPTDSFDVLLFSGGSSLMSPRSIPATAENVKRAIDVIDHQVGGGGTELLPAMKRALELPRDGGTARSIVVVTDGYIGVEAETFDLIREHLDDANLFAFGIGTSVNRFLMEGMARVGMGEPFVITDPASAAGQAEKFRQYIQSPVLTGVRAKFQGFDAYDVEPAHIPDVLAERPVVVMGKYRGQPSGSITVTGIGGEGPYTAKIDVSKALPDVRNGALRSLWARQRIAMLSDYNVTGQDPKRDEEVTRLGLAYHLLTAHTSFVAVDSLVRNRSGQSEKVDQPLPMPDGVSDSAVGERRLAARGSMAQPMGYMAAPASGAAGLLGSAGRGMGGGGYGAGYGATSGLGGLGTRGTGPGAPPPAVMKSLSAAPAGVASVAASPAERVSVAAAPAKGASVAAAPAGVASVAAAPAERVPVAAAPAEGASVAAAPKPYAARPGVAAGKAEDRKDAPAREAKNEASKTKASAGSARDEEQARKGTGSIISSLTVIGALPRAVVERVLRERHYQLRYVYEREAAKSPALAGALTLKLIIDSSGAVTEVVPVRSDAGLSLAVVDGVRWRCRQLVFP